MGERCCRFSFAFISLISRTIWAYAGQGAELGDLWSSLPELYFCVPVETATSTASDREQGGSREKLHL